MQEDVLNVFEAEHPEIQRYFLGRFVPPKLLAPGTLPSVPLPTGLRLQALHTDDVAEACVAALVAKQPGAFNVCADDVLRPQDIADILTTSGKYVEIPPGIVRAVPVTSHKTGVVPADVGWLDMGMRVPLMDNSKAGRELGWSPKRTAAEALRELLEGLVAGSGHGWPAPLRPRVSGGSRMWTHLKTRTCRKI